MEIDKIFVSVNARDFDGLSDWWSGFLGRTWDRTPMPSCREWDLAGCVAFQVLDNDGKGAPTAVTLHVARLDDEIARLRKVGIDVPEPVAVEGFATLRYAEFADPEGNPVGLLDGA